MEGVPVENLVLTQNVPTMDNIPVVVSAPISTPTLSADTAVPNSIQGKIGVYQASLHVNRTKDPTSALPVRRRSKEDYEEIEPEEVEPEEEEWHSDEESPKIRKRPRKVQPMESDDDEEYGGTKRKKVAVVKKPSYRSVTLNEPPGMKALRAYTSALKLGPRCFRNLNRISNVKEREAELIARLHECNRSWAGEYPTEQEINQAKEETRRKKAEKAREFIIDEEPGTKSTRKAAQKARDFVKTLGEEAEGEMEGDEDMEAPLDEELRDEE